MNGTTWGAAVIAFGSVGRWFESEHRLFSHHSVSAFSKLKSLAQCSLDTIQFVACYSPLSELPSR